MKFTRNIVIYLLYTYVRPLGHVHGRERFMSSRKTHGDGGFLAVAAVATASKSSNDATTVLALLTPHLIHIGDGNKNQGPLRQRHLRPQHRHRHLQDEPDWTQVGEDINGDAAGDYLGYSVDMSADGTHIVIGARGNSGYVRIFQRVNDVWEQVGNILIGQAFGLSVAMSVDGSRIAVGAPYGGGGEGYVRVFDKPTAGSNSSAWIQIGNDINGEDAGDLFGYSVAMSADGSRIAAGAPFDDGDPRVQVFGQPTTGSSDWTQIGNNINGQTGGEYFGFSVAMSADGNRIAVGARNSGYVAVLQQVGDSWEQIGNHINGEDDFEQFGWSVVMSADGSRIAVGAPYNNNKGSVRIFEQVNDSWEKIGNDINGKADDSRFGWSVAMSANGSRVAVGAPDKYTFNGIDTGGVRVFDQPNASDSVWIEVGNDINGEATYDNFGFAVAMSAYGSHIAVGTPFNDGDGVDSGHVRVFEYPSVEPECPLVHCDFATLHVTRFMSNEEQKQRILQDCGIISVTADKNGVPRNVNVFNSSDIKGTDLSFDPDLGSPNRRCPNSGPGRGRGGGPNATFPNCVPQGNLLIIQNNKYGESTPNDAARGGCMYIKFQNEVNLYDMGLLDMEEPMLTIAVIDSEATETVFTNPDNIGNNGFWNVRKTEPGFGVNNTAEIKMCLPGSGALSYLDYFACLPH